MLPRRPVKLLLVRLRRFVRNDQLILAMLAVVIGTATGAGEIVFRYMLQGVQFAAFGSSAVEILSWAQTLPWWHIVLAPTVGGLMIGLFVQYLMPGQRPRGVADVIEAAALRDGRMSIRAGLGAAIVSASSLGVGASTGREGPVVHIGATMGAWLAKYLGLSGRMTRTLLGCGVAAAVAASFNAPIAGVFFALEVVIGHYGLGAFAPVVLASVTGTIVSRLHYGDFPAFVLPAEFSIVSFWEFPAFALLGVISAAVAVVFMRATFSAEDVVRKLQIPPVLRPALGGLIVGIIAIWFPQVLGVGYEATDQALREALPLWLLLVLIVAKVVATSTSVACGFGGGVFSPSLFLGAMTGGAFGNLASMPFPELSSGMGAYTLVGMGAVAGAVLGAPISTILIMFEMTSDYGLTIAMMVAVVIASVLTEQIKGQSFFRAQLDRRGINIKDGRETRLISEVKVGDLMKHDFASIEPEASFDDLREEFHTARYGEVFVMGDNERLVGVVTLADLAHAEPPKGKDTCTAADACRANQPVLAKGDGLEEAMMLMDKAGESHIPVIDNRDDAKVVGVIHEHDVMLAYHRALMRARAEERGEPTDRKQPRSQA
ncbi:MAG: chloride channel protein [Pseudomonadota bacterium]